MNTFLKKKLISVHLSELPEPWRTQALENHKIAILNEVGYSDIYIFKDVYVLNKKGAISQGFYWCKTKEGQDYWNNFSKSLI